MPFPLSHTGKIDISHMRCSDYAVLNSIQNGLVTINASDVSKQDNIVSFKGGILNTISNMHLLAAVSSGTVEVHSQNTKISITYSLNFVGALIISVVLIFGIFAPGYYFSSNKGIPINILELVGWLIGAWFFIFGGGYLASIIRFPLFIQKAVKLGCNTRKPSTI